MKVGEPLYLECGLSSDDCRRYDRNCAKCDLGKEIIQDRKNWNNTYDKNKERLEEYRKKKETENNKEDGRK